MSEKTLPFPRGKTYGDRVVTLNDTTAKHLEGQIFEVEDTEHGTGMKVFLRCVKNDSGGSITSARRLYKFSTTDLLDFGRRISGLVHEDGMICKPMDDAYPVGTVIVDNDLFYVVEKGLCSITLEPTTVSLAAGDAVTTDQSGFLDGAVAGAGEYVVGIIDVDAAVASVDVVVHVAAGLVNSEA
ncbi:hypothetical protein LCGC14_1813440 [marine sediment metagenome]|uniref:Uncharacterized protein n=1 Tax=marine sediment metagenome TaxID=412755 RepID=A0A0F9GKV4_9ZZZZ